MQSYDFDNLPADMQQWMNNRFLNPIAYQNYGWEYWIQIDFIAWLDLHYSQGAPAPVQFDFQREIPRGGVRLDWLANENTAGPTTALEIKAQTLKRSTADFIQAVQDDVNKLGGVAGMANRLMIAGVVSQDAKDELNRMNFVPLTNPAGGVTACIYSKVV